MKNFSNPFGTKGKVVGQGRFSQRDFFLKSESDFKSSPTFRGLELLIFSAAIARLQALTLEIPVSKFFPDFGKKKNVY
jgi:hypothetical protein